MTSSSLKRVLMYCSFLFAAVLLFASWSLYRLMQSPMISLGKPAVIVELENQTSAQQFISRLQAKGLIHSPRAFLIWIRLQGLSQHLKAGVYQIYPGESAQQFLYRIVQGDVLVEAFTIVEGTNQSVISKKLAQAPYLHYRSTDWNQVSGKYKSPEGLLLADTYQYQAGSDSLVLLQQAHSKLMDYLNYSWANRKPNLPYASAYELLIAASIIEKESSIAQERKLISGVIINRLNHKMPLQMDPTVIYALGSDFSGKLTTTDLHIDSPFNTYKYRGLPPTPIAMVGKESILAAAQPEATRFLYFVAKGDGSHQFSETYEQQRQAVLRYQKNQLSR